MRLMVEDIGRRGKRMRRNRTEDWEGWERKGEGKEEQKKRRV